MEMFGEEIIFPHFIILALLFGALAIFGAIAAKSRKIASFQFQISIFIIIWIAGELIDVLQDVGLLTSFSDEFGMQVHLISMIFFSAMLWIRLLYSLRKHKKVVDTPSPSEVYFE